jgi:SAM-dependent methyltransferase
LLLAALPLNETEIERQSFFADPALDGDLPIVNEVFWRLLIDHIVQDNISPPRAILDVGCHTGGLLLELSQRFMPVELLGIEPLAAARATAFQRLNGVAAKVTLLDTASWQEIPAASIDLMTCHEVLYMEPDLRGFMMHLRRVLSSDGIGYIVLGCHAENPLWQRWKAQLVDAGQCVYDHLPLEIMEAASFAGLLPAVQPLRTSGWITYDPLRADFLYPDVRTMFDHHYRHKVIFRLRVADESSGTS